MGKSKSITIGYWYYPAFLHGLCKGPIDAFLEVRGAEKTAWSGELTASGAISINNPNLWGGEKDQGGMVGTLRVMMGEADQERNAYLTSTFGPKMTSWRGFCTVAWEGGKYGAMNPWPQTLSYKIRTIKAIWDNDECWYPGPAAVPFGPPGVVADWASEAPYINPANVNEVSGGGISGIFATPAEWQERALFETGRDYSVYLGRVTNATHNPIEPLAISLGLSYSPVASQETLQLVFSWKALDVELYVSKPIEYPDGTALDELVCQDLIDDHGLGYYQHFYMQGYVNDGVCVLQPVDDPPPEGYDYVLDTPQGGTMTLSLGESKGYMYFAKTIDVTRTGARERAMNPAHILVFARTQAELGREPVANINAESAMAAANWFRDNDFGLCTKRPAASESPASLERRICRVAGCSFTRSLVDGQWYIDIANGDYDIDELPVLSDGDVLSFSEIPAVLDNAVNSVSVRYFDVIKKQSVTTPPIRAMGLVAAFGENHKTFDYPEIPDGEMALRVAARELVDSTTPRSVFELVTTRVTYGWRPNMYFRLQLSKRGIEDTVCLVGEKQNGQLRSGAIKLKATQDPSSLPATVYTQAEPGVDTRPSQTPEPITLQIAFEAPYVDLVAAMSRADLNALPEDAGFIAGVAVDPASSRDFTMRVTPSGGDSLDAGNGEFCPTALIVEAAGPTSTEFTLTYAVGLSRVAIGAPVILNNEWCRVDTLDAAAGTITLGRGCADTVPQAHASGSRLWFYDEAVAADTTEYTDGETVDVKLLTNTGSQQLDEGDATAIEVTLDQRQFRPYPPAALKVNGEAYPTDPIEGDVTVSWVHRDRVLQQDQLVDASMAGVGPEDGTTYTVRWYSPATELQATESGIAGTSSTPWTPIDPEVRVTVEAVRDGVGSWQRAEHTFSWSGAAAWTPALLTDSPVWIDPKDSPVTLASGAIAEIIDRGARGIKFGQPDSSQRPMLVASGLNGLPVITLDGNDMLYAVKSGSTYSDNPSTVADLFRNIGYAWGAAVYRIDPADGSAVNREILYATTNANGAGRTLFEAARANKNAPSIAARRGDGDSAATLNTTADNGNEWVLVVWIIDYANADAFIRVNGEQEAVSLSFLTAGATSNTASKDLALFGGFNGSGVPQGVMKGDCAMVLAGNTEPAAGEIDKVEGYLAWRFGLQGNLPVGHPYKDARPLDE